MMLTQKQAEFYLYIMNKVFGCHQIGVPFTVEKAKKRFLHEFLTWSIIQGYSQQDFFLAGRQAGVFTETKWT